MMRQHQETVAEQAGGALRRIMLVVLIAALMAVMMAVTAAPALAANGGFTFGGKIAITKSDGKAEKGVLTAQDNHLKNN